MKLKDIHQGQIVRVSQRPPLWSDKDADEIMYKPCKVISIFTMIDIFAHVQLLDNTFANVNIEYLEPIHVLNDIFKYVDKLLGD
jgi:hypothetical protein